MVLLLPFPAGTEVETETGKRSDQKRRIQMSKGIITQENYQILKKEGTDRKSDRLSIYEKRFHALARRKGRREKKV